MEDMQPLKTVQRDDVVIYHPTENINLEVRVADDTVWLTQAQMAVLFGTQRQAITKHLQHIFEEQELEKKSTSSILEQVQKEGKRIVRRCVNAVKQASAECHCDHLHGTRHTSTSDRSQRI